MSEKFVHLHLHSQYSLLEGAVHIAKLATCLHEKNMDACAITDHGNMHGAIEFYRTMKQAGIKPLIGQGFYIQSFFESQAAKPTSDPFRLNIICINHHGYQNLIKLSSHAYQKIGVNQKPTIDYQLLKKYKDGLLAIHPGIESQLAQCLKMSDLEGAKKIFDWFKNYFPETSFLEIFPLEKDHLGQINQKIYDFGHTHNANMFISNNCLYLTKQMAYAQYILTLIGKQQKINHPDSDRFKGDLYYLKSYQEMSQQFDELPKSLLTETANIAQMCELDLLSGKKYLLPEIKAPENETGDQFFSRQVKSGFQEKFKKLTSLGQWSETIAEEKRVKYQTRLDYEMDMIIKMGYVGYFLIVADFVSWAKRNGILVGPGRGSGAGSLVAYSLDITDVDPIEYDLLFERFLNPARISMPDFDIDFEAKGRDRVIEYIRQKYGANRVSQISAIGTLHARAVIRSVARVLNIPYGQADKIAKLIPDRLGINLESALSDSADLRQIQTEGDESERQLIAIALHLEGLKSNLSTHAAGLVIMSSDISDVVPICLSADQKYWQTQYQMDDLESQGAVKFDLLGLRNLSILEEAVRLIAKNPKNPKIDITSFPLNESKVYSFISQGLTSGIFQLESDGMKAFVRQFQPQSFEELTALIAIYRPGPLQSGMTDDFIKRKHGLQNISYQHHLLEQILSTTYGVILYQEQVMRIAGTLAGFTLGEADILRRAMGKKKSKELSSLKTKFLDGCAQKKMPVSLSNELFELIEKFAGYGFNKSHSVAYGLISYQTAYLKTFYPLEFMSALMTMHSSDQDHIGKLLRECHDMKIGTSKPDINKSFHYFSPENGKIRFGLAAIKNLGSLASKMIVNVRQKTGVFTKLEDFYNNIDLTNINSRGIESLIKSGALDDLYPNRLEHLENLNHILSDLQYKKLTIAKNQLALFDQTQNPPKIAIKKTTQQSLNLVEDYYNFELDLLGYSFSPGPLSEYNHDVAYWENTRSISSVYDLKKIISEQQKINLFSKRFTNRQKGNNNENRRHIIGNIIKAKLRRTKNNDFYAIVEIEDKTGRVEGWMFEPEYSNFKYELEENTPVYVAGVVSGGARSHLFRITEFNSLQMLRNRYASGLRVRLNTDLEQDIFLKIKNLIAKHRDQNQSAKLFEFWLNFKKPHQATLKYEITDTLEFNEIFCQDLLQLFPDRNYQFLYPNNIQIDTVNSDC